MTSGRASSRPRGIRRRVPLMWQIVAGLVMGVAFGAVLNDQPEMRAWFVPHLLQPAGDALIRLIQMIVVPLVFTSMVIGVADSDDSRALGRLGAKTLIYFFSITLIAILIGLIAGNIFHPGTGMNLASLKPASMALPAGSDHMRFTDLLLEIIPGNIVQAMAQGKLLPVLFFAALFGFGIVSLPTARKAPLLTVLRAVSDAMFQVTGFIMAYSPVGVFGLIGVTVANFGLASLLPLAKLIGVAYLTIGFFAIVVLGTIARLANVPFWGLIRHIRSELLLAFSTASSTTVLAQLMKKLETFGVPAPLVSFIVPIGYSFNLDGASVFVGLGTLFVAQLYNIELGVSGQAMLVITMMVTSKGAAGVPGFMFVILSATFVSAGLPLEGVAFIAGVYRIIDMASTTLNVLGNALAPIVIARWEGMPSKEFYARPEGENG